MIQQAPKEPKQSVARVDSNLALVGWGVRSGFISVLVALWCLILALVPPKWPWETSQPRYDPTGPQSHIPVPFQRCLFLRPAKPLALSGTPHLGTSHCVDYALHMVLHTLFRLITASSDVNKAERFHGGYARTVQHLVVSKYTKQATARFIDRHLRSPDGKRY